MSKGRNYEKDKRTVISLPDAIVDPDTMMIEVLSTSVTSLTMFAFNFAKAFTVLTVVILVIISLKLNRIINFGPFIVVHYLICWICPCANDF